MKYWRSWLIIFVLVVGGTIKLTYDTARAPLLVKLSQQSSAYDKEKRELAEANAARLQALNERGDTLSAQLLQAQAANTKLLTEKRNAITKVTTGRACIDEPALRVLDNAPGLRVADLPPTTSSTAATGGRVATDTDLAGWSLEAGAQYRICKYRLDALIDWYPPHPQAQHQ